ncbi:MAG: hemolysin family protein [Deltaproteobacteria bacterium]
MMISLGLPFLSAVIVLAWAMEAFFAGTETAFVSVNFLKLMHLIERRNKRALRVHDLIKKPDRLLATTLIGTNLAVVLSSSSAAALFFPLGPVYGPLVTTLVMTPVSFIFCELLPKTICRYRANRVVLGLAEPLMWSERLFLPLVNLFVFFANSVARVINPRGLKKNPFLTKDEIKSLIKDISREGILEPHEKEAIDKIFEMTLTKAVDIMIPLREVVSFDAQESLESLREKIRVHPYARFPVTEGKAFTGMVHVFDLFYAPDEDWHSHVRPLLRVEQDESLDQVFAKLQPQKERMAAVYKDGAVVGILTMEDLMEEITSHLTASREKGVEKR